MELLRRHRVPGRMGCFRGLGAAGIHAPRTLPDADDVVERDRQFVPQGTSRPTTTTPLPQTPVRRRLVLLEGAVRQRRVTLLLDVRVHSGVLGFNFDRINAADIRR